MPVSHELQNQIADLSAAIAAKKPWGRTEQERMRRSLQAIARDAAEAERGAGTERFALKELIAGVTQGVADLGGLARRADAVLAGGEAGR